MKGRSLWAVCPNPNPALARIDVSPLLPSQISNVLIIAIVIDSILPPERCSDADTVNGQGIEVMNMN